MSLLNNDDKLFARILVERLKAFLQNYIKEVQTGFLPNRQIQDNLRTVLHAVQYYDKQPEKEVCFFFADAEKAFDNLNWEFMLLLMGKNAVWGRIYKGNRDNIQNTTVSKKGK